MNSKAYEFDEIANGPFLPVYPVIAQQIKERTGITAGICLDIGSGGGHLGLSLAQITDLNIVLMDILQDALTIAETRAAERGLDQRASTLLADVHEIPLEDESVNLCVSRGSVWFWEDQVKAFQEIYRVLVPGGMAYIGGGYGTKELKEQVDKNMMERDSDWPNTRRKIVEGNTVERFTQVTVEAGITDFDIKEDEKGIWVIFKKVKH